MIRIIKTTILMAALSSAIVLPSLAQDKEPVDMRKIMKTYFYSDEKGISTLNGDLLDSNNQIINNHT